MSPKNRRIAVIVILILTSVFFIVLLNDNNVEGYDIKSSKENMGTHLTYLVEKLSPVSEKFKEVRWQPDKKSFAINKESVHICMLDENGNLYDDNTLTYVILHEIAHCELTNEIGHTDAFEQRFQKLLNRAFHLGLYNPSIPMRSDYCLTDDE